MITLYISEKKREIKEGQLSGSSVHMFRDAKKTHKSPMIIKYFHMSDITVTSGSAIAVLSSAYGIAVRDIRLIGAWAIIDAVVGLAKYYKDNEENKKIITLERIHSLRPTVYDPLVRCS